MKTVIVKQMLGKIYIGQYSKGQIIGTIHDHRGKSCAESEYQKNNWSKIVPSYPWENIPRPIEDSPNYI